MVCPSLSGLFIDNSVNGDFHAASVRPRNGLPLGWLCNKKYDKPGMRILNHDYNLGLPVSEVFCWGSLSKQNMHHRKRGQLDLEPGLAVRQSLAGMYIITHNGLMLLLYYVLFLQ